MIIWKKQKLISNLKSPKIRNKKFLLRIDVRRSINYSFVTLTVIRDFLNRAWLRSHIYLAMQLDRQGLPLSASDFIKKLNNLRI